MWIVLFSKVQAYYYQLTASLLSVYIVLLEVYSMFTIQIKLCNYQFTSRLLMLITNLTNVTTLSSNPATINSKEILL